MAGTNLTTVDKILKDLYLGPIRDQITDGMVLRQQMETNHEDVSGRQALIPLHYSRNAGIGSVAEDGVLPSAGTQKYKQLTYTLKYLYGRLRITGQTLKATKNDQGAFARALEREIDGLIRDFKNELNRILNGDGAGTIAVTGAGATSATMPVVSTRFLTEDMRITVSGVDAQILTVDSDTQVTLTSAITFGTAANVTRTGADEANGIANIVLDTGTVGGLTATGNLFWQSFVQAATAPGDITLADMQLLYRKIEERQNRPPKFFFARHAIRDMYVKLLVADKRFVNNLELDGGFKGVEFNGIPLIVDKDATANVLYALNPEHLMVFESTPVDWMDNDGNILHRVMDKDAYEATLFYYFQVGTDSRRLQGKLTSVNES